VKYADAKDYDISRAQALDRAAAEILSQIPIAAVECVTLVKPENLEIELAATLLYEHSHHPYEQILEVVGSLPVRIRQEIIDLGMKDRGRYDEVARAYAAGAALQFDLLVDTGAFRDLHRHRRCIQILQGYTAAHGYEMPSQVEQAGLTRSYKGLMEDCRNLWGALQDSRDADIAASADYVLPLAFRRRALFKMDLAEAIYICELRTAPGGHFSYRRIAFDMYEKLRRWYPEIAKGIRVHDVTEHMDILKR